MIHILISIERDTVITDGARRPLEFSLALVNYRVVKAAGQDQLAGVLFIEYTYDACLQIRGSRLIEIGELASLLMHA
jgi:hypothetical protein